jgi:hypothetical protein
MREARYVSLIPWTLRSGSEQFIYNWKLENNLDLDQGNWRQHNGIWTRGKPEQRYISCAEAFRKQKSC